MLLQKANIQLQGNEETYITRVRVGSILNNVKASIMPPLQFSDQPRSRLKQPLGCSYLWGSSLTLGDLHCSSAPAHLDQMISSSTSNLLILIAILKAPLPPLVFSLTCHSIFPIPNILLSFSISSSSLLPLSFLVFVGMFEVEVQTESGVELFYWRVCVSFLSVWHVLRSKTD